MTPGRAAFLRWIMDSESTRPSVSLEEITLSNMLTVNALVELLDEHGILTRRDILDRVKKLRAEMTAKRRDQ